MRTPVAAIIVAAVLALIEARAEEPQKKPLLLDSAIPLADQTLPAEKTVELAVPSLPSRPGRIIVLRFRMVSYNIRPGGCNLNAQVQLNGLPLGRWTAGGSERLIGRSPSFELVAGHRGFAIFNGSVMSVLFAPDVDRGDRMTKDGLGATFTLDVTDLARGVDGNSLTFRNLRKLPATGQPADLIVRGITIGWLDRRQLPAPPDLVPTRPALQTAVRVGPTTVAAPGEVLFGQFHLPDDFRIAEPLVAGLDRPRLLCIALVERELGQDQVRTAPEGGQQGIDGAGGARRR
jgi:hypothetical protein